MGTLTTEAELSKNMSFWRPISLFLSPFDVF